MEKLKLGNEEWHDWESFLVVSGLKNRKSIYDWVRSGRAKVKKIGSASFFKLA
jgi:hypothetical protein